MRIDESKGFGFIAADEGIDVIAHCSEILGDGFRTLAGGDWSYVDLRMSPKGPKAERITRL